MNLIKEYHFPAFLSLIMLVYGCNSIQKASSVKPNEQFKDLGNQVMEGSIQGGVFFKNETDDEYVYTVSRGRPAHLLGYDLKTNKLITDLPLPNEVGSWDLVISSDNWLYVAGNTGHLYKHKPSTKLVEDLGKFLTESLIYDLTAGENGEIFGGTYSSSRVFRYHPADGFSDPGNGSMIAGEQYVRSLAYHQKAKKIYAGVGSHAGLIELDLKTGTKRQMLPDEFRKNEFVYNMALLSGFSNGDRLFAWLLSGNKHQTLVYNLESGKLEQQINKMEVKSAIKDPNSNKIYYLGGGKLLGNDLSKPHQQEEILGTFKDSTALCSMWGKDKKLYILTVDKHIITYDPSTGKTSVTDLDVPPQPIKINSLVSGPDGRIWTGGYLTGGHAAYNPKTGKVTQYPGIDQAEGMTVMGQYIYMGVYPNARMYVYDTKKKWYPENNNPRLIKQISGQDRPFAGVKLEDSDKLFFGTVPRFGKLGGSLLEYDIRTDVMTTYNDLIPAQSVVSLVYAGGTVYGGTTVRGGIGIMPTEQEAKLFGWNPVTKSKVFEIAPVAKARAITCLINGPEGKVWGIADGTLFIFDPSKKEVIFKKDLYTVSKGGPGVYYEAKLAVHPSGIIYGTGGGNLFKIDPETMDYTIINKGARLLAIDKQGAVYTVINETLWQYNPYILAK